MSSSASDERRSFGLRKRRQRSLEQRRQARKRLLVIIGGAIALFVSACGEKSQSAAMPAGPVPDSFRVAFTTSKGTFVVQANRAWAPNGVDRFYALATTGFFDDNRFFRVLPNYIAQFGINDRKAVNEQWDAKPIPDDPRKESNTRGTLVFTASGPNTRSHQVFINLKDNPKLDAQGFVPFGRVVSGMEVADSLYDDYGDDPQQHLISTLGNNYLLRMFPKLDYIISAKVITDSASR
jgi:cyclophilin family peptidyl-prolyl cis-trans isomerase